MRVCLLNLSLLLAGSWNLVGEELSFDHVSAIQRLQPSDIAAGKQLYTLHCASCHGADGALALNPLARKFASDPLKFGTDPYALWKTISYGNGLMFRWDGILDPTQRYQIVHFLRESILKPNNPSQYFKTTADFYQALPARAQADAEMADAQTPTVDLAPGLIDGSGGTRMQYGPFLQYAVAYGPIKDKNAAHIENTTEKALMVALPDGFVICYDTARLSISGIWKGDKLADTQDTHHTSYKGSRPMMPSGELLYHHVDAIGWTGGTRRFRGHFLYGDRVVLHYAVGDRAILEMPSLGEDDTLHRSFEIGPGRDAITCLFAHDTEPVSFPPSEQSHVHRFAFHPGKAPTKATNPDKTLNSYLKGGPRRWPQTVQTHVTMGEAVNGYAADELAVPLANPYGSWMRLTALDFFTDGRIATSTLSGDVWIVSWEDENPSVLTWSRFASGLYEPLGLRVVDDKVYVRGRDRITRLHDLNADGEADYYESFYEDTNEIGASYHAFSYDLQVDTNGYFYFAQGAYKSPLEGGVVRVSPNGGQSEIIAHDFRNPNGLGVGPNGWITVADNPSAVAIYNGFALVKPGGSYGFERERTEPMLVVLPASVDSSSTSQCWTDPKRWGPLSGAIIHTSYSRHVAFYCLTQDLDPHPNGFAIQLPFVFRSAPMRSQVHPLDGQLYIACKRGWDTNAPLDGAIYRLRHTGDRCHWIRQAAATPNGIQLTFASPLDPSSIPDHFTYVREPDKPTEGKPLTNHQTGTVSLRDPRTLEIIIPGIERERLEARTERDPETGKVTRVIVHPAISLQVKARAADGTPINQVVHATINALPSR